MLFKSNELNRFKKFFKKISKQKFIKSLRGGSTSIGHLLEKEMGISENNKSHPDIDEKYELKSTRSNSKSLITLFTFDKNIWKINNKSLIEQYGYFDKNSRHALYSTVNINPNEQGFYLKYNENNIVLKNTKSENIIAEWNVEVISEKFITKFNKLILSFADNEFKDGVESFHFNKAFLLSETSSENFKKGLKNGEISIDIRMHIKETGTVRNHGTGFRISKNKLMNLYKNKNSLIK